MTGNTVIDALIWVRDRVLANNELQAELAARYPFLNNGKTILVTGHRRESFGRGFEQSVMRWLKSPRKTKMCRLSIRCISTLTSASRSTAFWGMLKMSF